MSTPHPRPPADKLHKRTSIASSTTPIPQLVRSRSTIHLPLHRRIIFPHDDPSSDIPQIVKGDNGEVELELINERLYHLLALAVRAYVTSWYIRFTPDRSFPPLIHQQIIYPILSPVLSNLNTTQGKDRICHLLLIDLPVILHLHVQTYYEAKSSRAYLPSDGQDGLSEGYYRRLPLLSITPSKDGGGYTLSPLYLSALSSALLNRYITEQRHVPDVERLMAREILSKSILCNVLRRLCEGWFWYQLVLKILGEPDGAPSPSPSPSPSPEKTKTKEKETEKEGRSLDQIILNFINTCITLCIRLWGICISIVALYSAAPKTVDRRYERSYEPLLLLLREVLGIDGYEGLEMRRWAKRMIWGCMELVVGLCGGMLDRLFPHLLKSHFLTPSTSLRLIDLMERLLFPDGYPGPSPVDPTPQEALDLRERAEKRIDELVPSLIKRVFFNTKRGTKVLLDPLEDSGCNAHLVGMVLNAVVGGVIPDLVIPLEVDEEEKNEEDRQAVGADGGW
ncbi:hypothetical protein I302_108879 [Kwoniella bestiolae CBS 10118]|uniref:PXA domain-containing protein n=1 Tax=Kwoniella bestiolae CBS 10118 TaxID=1296100 RepID=A0A1B9FUB7_9TREE|nr:hypothetical protein I302_08016 [Kwoniella bestiolae CBS 10118]OCF22369.1 hypothetical protein I302_08016 [Kwoniella bestiolae CBS 10118]